MERRGGVKCGSATLAHSKGKKKEGKKETSAPNPRELHSAKSSHP